MADFSQAIQTGRLSFCLSFGAAWLAWTGLLCLTVIEATSAPELFDHLPPALLPILTLTLGAGSAGAIIGLCFGSPLSRAYCWIFGAAIGAWVGPVVLITLEFTFLFGLMSDAPMYWAWAGLIVLGTFCGYVRARQRSGFGSASRRAAVYGLIVGFGGGVFLAAVSLLYFRRIPQPMLPWGILCLLVGFAHSRALAWGQSGARSRGLRADLMCSHHIRAISLNKMSAPLEFHASLVHDLAQETESR